MIEKVGFTMYPVTEVARARQFYEETLGLQAGLVSSHGPMTWIEYDLPGGGCLAITDASGEQPGAHGGTVALEVRDLDAIMEDLRGKSVEFKSEVIHGPACRMVVVLDSEGNSLLLHQHNEK